MDNLTWFKTWRCLRDYRRQPCYMPCVLVMVDMWPHCFYGYNYDNIMIDTVKFLWPQWLKSSLHKYIMYYLKVNSTELTLFLHWGHMAKFWIVLWQTASKYGFILKHVLLCSAVYMIGTYACYCMLLSFWCGKRNPILLIF